MFLPKQAPGKLFRTACEILVKEASFSSDAK
jgi:hypothetical protein